MESAQTRRNDALSFVARLGHSVFFLGRVLAAIPYLAAHPRLTVHQLYHVGVLSLVIVVISGSFIGMVLGLQGYRTLSDFGAEQTLGVFVALVTVRELAPVVTALLFAGRAGSAITAEIGLMKATEQLSALEMMAVDPVQRIVAPRFMAGILAMPLLAAIFSVMAIGVAGANFIGVQVLGADNGSYWSLIQTYVYLSDLYNGLVKSAVFGAAICWIAVYQGYKAVPTSEGVSRATTTTVVVSSLVVLGLDFILTAMMFGS